VSALRLAALAVALTGCAASGLSPQEQAARCADLADAVSKAHLTSTPSEQVAQQVAVSLDNRLSRLGSPAVHDPAVQLHQQLHAIESERRRGDSARADAAAPRARDAIDRLATACDLPATRFLG
jgi:hypothetical protein